MSSCVENICSSQPAERTPARTLLCFVMALAVALPLIGCNVYRGIPSHGGGKRFDEEQRVISGAIRRAVADMDLSELEGKRVQVITDSMSHDGGASAQWPGLQDITLNGEYRKYAYDNARDVYREYGPRPTEDVWRPSYRDDNESEYTSIEPTVRYRAAMLYSPHRASSNVDLNYLKAAVSMKMYHSGIAVTVQKPEAILNIMVDVLGTNRSRTDSILWRRDDLVASCEVTYYARDAKTGKLLFKARATAAQGTYSEASMLGWRSHRISRSLASVTPTPLPVDGESTAEPPIPSNGSNGLPLASKPGTAPVRSTESLETEYLDTLVTNAEANLEMENLGEAERTIDAIRLVDPNHPGLSEVEEMLRQKSR